MKTSRMTTTITTIARGTIRPTVNPTIRPTLPVVVAVAVMVVVAIVVVLLGKTTITGSIGRKNLKKYCHCLPLFSQKSPVSSGGHVQM